MKEKTLTRLDEVLKKLEEPSMENLEDLVHESLKFFEDFKTVLESDNEEEKEKALKIASTFQHKLEDQAEKALKQTGLSKEELEKFISSPENFDESNWENFQHLKNEISDFSHLHVEPEDTNSPEPSKVKKMKKNRFYG